MLRVDGKTVWNMLDARENLKIGADGFFNLYHYGKTNTFAVRPAPSDAEVVSICWSKDATPKTRYLRGEELDVSGMLLEVAWSDDRVTQKQVTADMVSGFDSRKVAPKQTLTVTHEGATVTLPISVRPKDNKKDLEVERCG